MSELSRILTPGELGTDAETVRDTRPIVLHNPELTARLDRLFAEHFRVHRHPTLRVTVNHALKRLLDIAVALVGLILLWPVLLVAGLATVLDTGWPVTYWQLRRIRFGRRARIWKMRTLVVGADRKLGALVSVKHNTRFLNIDKSASDYTRVGRWLERLWIVELPQLWSVLRGQMSLVGNRPIPDYVIDALGTTPDVLERFASPQGLTGYVQVIGRDNVTDEERIQLEYQYSRVFEEGDVFLEDLHIVMLTVLAYLGLGRPRTPADILTDQWSKPAAVAAEPDPGCAMDWACPTCYVVGAACNPAQCAHECIASCPHAALRCADDGRPVFLGHCVACSRCVLACPLRALDKAPLRRDKGTWMCGHCGATYAEDNGVIDLLPRRDNLAPSPYFEFYNREYVHDNPNMHREDTEWKLRELRPLLDAPGAYRNLLDVGCGAGELGRRLAAELHVAERASSDWSSEILAVARQGAPQHTFVRADAAYLPLRNGTCDLALLIDVLEHQHRPEQVLRELRRVARQLLLRTPLEDCWYERLRRRYKDVFRESSGHVVHFNLASVRELLSQSGFVIRRQSVAHIAWAHWRRYLLGPHPWRVRGSTLARLLARILLPRPLHRRILVMNYNALCTSVREN